MGKKNYWLWTVSLVVAMVISILSLGLWFTPWSWQHMHEMSMNHMSEPIEKHALIMQEHRDVVVSSLLDKGDYACCLSAPCSYCITKSPQHGEGPSCSCLDDVVNGRHPCGECMGEILEGHGNKYLAKYFARSLSDELGEYSLDTLHQIMEDKYDISVSEQY